MANKNTRKKNKPAQQQLASDKVRQQAQTQATAGRPKRKKGRWKEYFRGVRLEMKKVIWPTGKELGSYTIVVLLTCAFFALLFWAVDTGVLAALRGIFGIGA